jgi:hypothetical protein
MLTYLRMHAVLLRGTSSTACSAAGALSSSSSCDGTGKQNNRNTSVHGTVRAKHIFTKQTGVLLAGWLEAAITQLLECVCHGMSVSIGTDDVRKRLAFR